MSSTSRTPATKTTSSVRSGQSAQPTKPDTTKKTAEKTPDKEVAGQVGSEPTVNNESLERKISDRNDRKVSNSAAKHGQGERKTSDRVDPAVKKVSNS